MTTHKRTINLDDDNWADYISDDYPTSLVGGSRSPKTASTATARS
jgi:hypothetical protein